MEILGFLFGLGCLVIIAWAIAFVGHVVFGRKLRQQNRPPHPPSPKSTEQRSRNSSPSTPVLTPVLPRRVDTLRQPPVSTRVRRRSSRHQQYIQQAELVLEQLRSCEAQLPKALAILRRMNPYAFEELLLTCCHERGWEIERNFSYSNDGGLDGRVTINEKLYLIQAKRYRGYINPKHIRDFYKVIQKEEAYGGFFIHSGRTGELSKKLLREYEISLLSGQRLVNFVLGQRLKVVG